MPSRNAASREVCTSLAMLNARRTPRQRKYHEIKVQLPSSLVAPVVTPTPFVENLKFIQVVANKMRGETSSATKTFAYLGIHAGEAFVGTLQDPGLLHVNTRHCLGKRLREQQRAGGRDIVNASRCARPEYLRLAIAGYLIATRFQLPFYSIINKDKEAPSFNSNKSDPCVISQGLRAPNERPFILNYECVKRVMGRRHDELMMSMERTGETRACMERAATDTASKASDEKTYFTLYTYTRNHTVSRCIVGLYPVFSCGVQLDTMYYQDNHVSNLAECSVSRNHCNDRASGSLFGISLLYAYRLHRQASVTIIIGSTKHRWPNWRWLAERFAFGIAAQLRAATRDFPVHDCLHASQTPKGCSFTGLPPPAGMGSPYRMDDGWAAGDSDAATTAGGATKILARTRMMRSTNTTKTADSEATEVARVPKTLATT
ncbi:hypothetical protein G5I_07929 [Acromyrmex echinatior]|uniref:Uncharacterized protein n=1 Tax=Acromyrmex echinatior TaxID=103372 RepID=F4WQ69_ACREC|nr:hypothetical protein G5I_07929 [Acromyrmex echinatior]